jgi:hypothetical protein
VDLSPGNNARRNYVDSSLIGGDRNDATMPWDRKQFLILILPIVENYRVYFTLGLS